ncbi:alpha/beta hydrolase [Stutzerimonas stutzeri]|uniref:alpha/beta hydrolase n=1 Tax=Stutzerimonas stutzeri TaxID=316 RepID=UPI00210D9E5F|nr:alpha/beta hydrolase [Stutzerimonas stutzeri]MCQ4259896.1 alpha/beta hydrolase [Stutzerimonas stutzeri]
MKLNINGPWSGSEDIAQVQRFNRKLARLPRFRIRNRITPRLIQALLRASQIGGGNKLRKHGLEAESRVVGMPGAPVAVRIIRPRGKAKGVVLDIHGGGWVIGNAQMNDDMNIAIVDACSVTVVSVDYRLAVSTPVEGLMEDCLSAARWLLSDSCEEFAGLPVIVVGESAGGHLAAATLLALKRWPDLLQRVRGTVLYYGVYDLTGTASVRTAPPETLVLDGPGMVEAFRMLTPDLTDQERQQPPLSPLYGDFEGLPPALMFAGELDPLRDDTLEIAARWNTSAPVEVHLLPHCPHGFIHFPTKTAAHVLAYSRAWISRRLGETADWDEAEIRNSLRDTGQL